MDKIWECEEIDTGPGYRLDKCANNNGYYVGLSSSPYDPDYKLRKRILTEMVVDYTEERDD